MVRRALLALLLLGCTGRSAAVGLEVVSVTDPLASGVPSTPGARFVAVRMTLLNATAGPIPLFPTELSLEGGATVVGATRLPGLTDACDRTLPPDERFTCQAAFEIDAGFTPTQLVYFHDGIRVSAPISLDGPVRPGVDGGRRDAGTDAGTAPRTSRLDLLFVVDNSGSMAEEQASLGFELPRLLGVLGTGDYDQDGDTTGPEDFEPFDMHLGVVTTDMGTGGFTIPTCARADFGDDGILRTQGRIDFAGCMATYPQFLSFRPGESTEERARDLACVATTGTGGCGFEQPLEATLKALSPSAPTDGTAPGYAAPVFFRNTFGHADTNNHGFVRDDSVLAIVLLTDEEDCSARDAEIFNPSSPVYGATDLNLRCFAHADAALHPVARYVDGLLQLRRIPSRLVFVPIAGVPVDLVPTAGAPVDWGPLTSDDPAVRDDRLEERVDPTMPTRLIPSCNVPGRGLAFPPVRLLRVAQQLESRGASVSVASVCQDSFAAPIDQIIRAARASGG